ncbi:MAG: response regulator [Anaerolineae bacterium]|nr:response regulator [Anaerolineae bacterium]
MITSTSTQRPTRQPVVLYVEDDALSREVLSFYLMRMGLSREEQIYLFDSSENFLEQLRALPVKPDVILLDIRMWPVDGFGVLAQLREQPDYTGIPVVALTASVMSEEISLMRDAGFSGCITKPIDQASFAHSLTQILDGEKIWKIY